MKLPCRNTVVRLSCLVLAPVLWAAPAVAQNAGAQLAGRWSCVQTANDPRGRQVTSVTRYVLLIYQNRTFRAQGTLRGGVSFGQFAAQGNWRVWREKGVWWFAARGRMVAQFNTGARTPGNHMTFGRVFNVNTIAYRTRPAQGPHIALHCGRQ